MAKKYLVLRAQSPSELSLRVTEYLAKGAELVGGLVNQGNSLCQSVIYDNDVINEEIALILAKERLVDGTSVSALTE